MKRPDFTSMGLQQLDGMRRGVEDVEVRCAKRLRDIFLDPDERDLLVDWDEATEGIVVSFRQSIGTRLDDQRSIDLVRELSLASPHFPDEDGGSFGRVKGVPDLSRRCSRHVVPVL